MSKSLEAKITPKVMKWFASVVEHSAPFEIKHTKGSDSFKMRELQNHQRNYLMAATIPTGMTYKIRDAKMGHNPFDCIHYKNSEAYVVIVYPLLVVAIEIRDLLKIDTSLHVSNAVLIARYCDTL